LLPVLLLVTAFIVYGSLYPWQFHAASIPGNPLLILLGSWSFELNRYFLKDTAVNIVLYLPFGTACYLWLAHRAVWIRTAAPLLLALILSSSIEMIQLFDAHRVCSMIDVVTNVTGTALGAALATRFRSMVSVRPGTGGPLFLLCCWTAALLFPFMPDLSSHHLIHKLSTFTSPPFSAVAFFYLLVMWIAAARLMEAAVGRNPVPLLLFLLPVRLFVDGITLTWTDCLPAILALLIWFAWPSKSPHRDAVLAALSIGAILITGLFPFHFSTSAQAFSWIPFRALFTTDWENGFAIFFRKCFAYGSTIWLLGSAGLSLAASAVGVAALLGTLEVAQLWLPSHVAESTDPLHALLLAWIFRQLEARNRTPG
jgi:hypothetical protein